MLYGFMMAAGSGLKNLQCSDTKCWGQGRQCGRSNNTLDEEELAYENKQDTQRERERDRHKETFYFKEQP